MNFTPVTGWYYRSAWDRAAAWTSVHYLYKFLTGGPSPGPRGKVVDIQAVLPGDVIQLSFLQGQFSHSLFVVETGSVPTPNNVLVATHTADGDFRKLSSYYFQAYRCLQISV